MYCNIFYECWDCLKGYLLIHLIIDYCLYWAHLADGQECLRNYRSLHSSLISASSDKCTSLYRYIHSNLKFSTADNFHPGEGMRGTNLIDLNHVA